MPHWWGGARCVSSARWPTTHARLCGLCGDDEQSSGVLPTSFRYTPPPGFDGAPARHAGVPPATWRPCSAARCCSVVVARARQRRCSPMAAARAGRRSAAMTGGSATGGSATGGAGAAGALGTAGAAGLGGASGSGGMNTATGGMAGSGGGQNPTKYPGPVVVPSAPQACVASPKTLVEAGACAGVRVGTALSRGIAAPYPEIFKREFNAFTPESDTKILERGECQLVNVNGLESSASTASVRWSPGHHSIALMSLGVCAVVTNAGARTMTTCHRGWIVRA
jgi:hypothetical protein